MRTRKQINGALVLLLLCICTDAQTAAPLETGKSPLVLAVVYNPGFPPEYQLLPDGSGVWYSRFARIKNWQQAPGSLVVDAVYVTSTMEGEAVTVRVAVLYGKSHDAGTLVGTYAARENEKLVVSALTRFGIEPFEITLVRTAPVVPSPPKLENKTKALDIISVQPEGLSLPSYKLTLRNVSTKNKYRCWIGKSPTWTMINQKPFCNSRKNSWHYVMKLTTTTLWSCSVAFQTERRANGVLKVRSKSCNDNSLPT